MKIKIAYVIKLLLLSAMLAVLGTGCGREGKTESRGNFDGGIAPIAEGEAHPAPGEDFQASEGAYGEAGTDWLTLQEELRPAIVQIYCGDYRGSGVVWEITEEEVRVISSGHLLKNGETCEILCYAGVYYEAKVERILENCDIGFAVFPAQMLQEDGVELRAAAVSERGKEELIQGEEFAVYGSMDYAAGTFVKGYLIEAESEIQFEGYDSSEPFMLCGIVREKSGEADAGGTDAAETGTVDEAESGGTDTAGEGTADEAESEDRDTVRAGIADEVGSEETGAAEAGNTDMVGNEKADIGLIDAGMSGSGVFDGQGKLLGILAGGDGESGFAAVPVWEIAPFLPISGD